MQPGTLRVLYVDDDRNDLALLAIAVDHSDVDIWLQTANSGNEAIDRLEGRGQFADRELFPLPHLILMNIRMPEFSGYDFLEWRLRSAYRGIPVVAFSGASDGFDRERALALGAEAYLSKPNGFEDWKSCAGDLWDLGNKLCSFTPRA